MDKNIGQTRLQRKTVHPAASKSAEKGSATAILLDNPNLQIRPLRMGEQMKIIYELSWLWETLGIALMAAVACVAGAMLICRAKKKKLSKKSAVVIGIAAFIIAIAAVIEIARIPMPL